MVLVIPLASYAFYSETILNWINKKWPGKTDDTSPSKDGAIIPLARSSAASVRTDKALSLLEEKNDYPTTRMDEVIKGIERQRTTEIKWPLKRRGTRRPSDVEALEQNRLSVGR